MMCGTAALQVNVDLGASPGDVERRWLRAHAVSPVLAAAFANSPFAGGRPSGLRSTRLATWAGVDRSRTVAEDTAGSDAADAYATFVLDAGVMLLRCTDDDFVALDGTLSFARWIEQGHELGWPTHDDLSYHLTTLFPTVRPRGWLELRAIDVLPDPWWQVAVAVAHAVLDTDDTVFPGLWPAARNGLAHPSMASAAGRLFAGATDALSGTPWAPAVAEYVSRYVSRGRCPADDLLDQWTADGSLPVPRQPSWT
jgi:glutamate--cysteine ligase